LPDVSTYWLPLQARTAVMGALGILAAPPRMLTLGERDWLQNFAVQIAPFWRRSISSRPSRPLKYPRLRAIAPHAAGLRPHELKTPLAALQAATDGLEREPTQPSAICRSCAPP